MKKYTYIYRVAVEKLRNNFHRYYEFDEPKSKEYIIGKAFLDFGFNAKGKPIFIKIVEILELIRENDKKKYSKFYFNEEDYKKEE